MESKKISQLATELTPDLSDLTIIGDPNTGISKKITLSQMASLFTGTVEEYATLAAFPLVGVADTIYIALDTNVIYRYDTSLSAYVILSPNVINSLVFSDANGFDGTITLVGSVATLTITTALTSGSVPFIGASGALSQDNANLFFDDTNNRLGIATASPTTPLDVFGSGIIGRFNATSTNNAYLGFASNGTNKWSAGNVQSDHRFRIFSEANSAELITILQTGEFGIGIANPTTKFHIDGGASALIANLDANVSVAKSISFRSDNSNRFNIEVSGTESGSNAGADFFIRRYSDAGSLIDTPLTIVRSTGYSLFTGRIGIGTITPSTLLHISTARTNGTNVNVLTLSDTTTGAQTVGFGTRIQYFSNGTSVEAAIGLEQGGTGTNNESQISFYTQNTASALSKQLTIGSTGAATFSSTLLTGGDITVSKSGDSGLNLNSTTTNGVAVTRYKTTAAGNLWGTGINITAGDSRWEVYNFTLGASPFILSNAGDATFTTTSGLGITIITNDVSTLKMKTSSGSVKNWGFATTNLAASDFGIYQSTSNGGDPISAGIARLYINASGQIAMGRTTASGGRLTVDGDVYFHNISAGAGNSTLKYNYTSTGLMTYDTSSRLLKKDIENLSYGLEDVLKMSAKKYKWKRDDSIDLGFIADEMVKIIPEIVFFSTEMTNETTGVPIGQPLSINYDRLIPILVIAIQELKAEIDILKALINK
jgi:hypothetical protein